MVYFPDLIRYTGNMADSVPRSELLNMLSRRFNQPQILYWGPQCNKAIEALYPNIDIRRKGRSKVYPFYKLHTHTHTQVVIYTHILLIKTQL